MEFQKFKKIPRLSRDCIITEKIDGTNAQIRICKALDIPNDSFLNEYCLGSYMNLFLFAGSRKRWITPASDNHGFANWVKENSKEIMKLGEGHHYGEWWGQGIQRKYDMDKKVFSLFNTKKWSNDGIRPKCCSVVPVLYQGPFDTQKIQETLASLKTNGSVVSPSFMKPEGIVALHLASGQLYKKTIENDEKPKGITS